jgi:hypothetical protein
MSEVDRGRVAEVTIDDKGAVSGTTRSGKSFSARIAVVLGTGDLEHELRAPLWREAKDRAATLLTRHRAALPSTVSFSTSRAARDTLRAEGSPARDGQLRAWGCDR